MWGWVLFQGKDEEEHENDKGGRKKRKNVTKQIAKKKNAQNFAGDREGKEKKINPRKQWSSAHALFYVQIIYKTVLKNF